jgi:Domain of unknown function (DUF4394)
MTKTRFLTGAAIVAALAIGGAVSANATNLLALTGNRTLLTIDSSPAVVRQVNVSGLDADLLGIDFRPFDGKLYGLLANGKVVTINPRTGVATFQVTLPTSLPTGRRYSVDFNPAADRMRIVSSGGTAAVNLAANVDLGTVVVGTGMLPGTPAFPPPVAPATTNPLGGVTPSVIGVAYTNNRAGTKGTLLFDIDDATDALYIQQPPGAGTLTNVGNQLGISPGQIGFDIRTERSGRNIAFLISGNKLYNPDLLSGLAGKGKQVRFLNGPVRDLAAFLRK